MSQNGGLKLRATITIDFLALDFKEAAETQTVIEDWVKGVAKKCDATDTSITVKERRDRTEPTPRKK